MIFSFEDFFPKYPAIDPIKDDRGRVTNVLNAYDTSARFVDVIPSKKEFASLKLDARGVDRSTDAPGKLLPHQIYLSRFLSSHSGNDEILVAQEMGTGKTCTADGTCEKLRYEPNSFVKAAFVFAKGQGLLNNFKREILFTCTDGRYIPQAYDSLTEREKLVRSNKILSKFYTFYTFETFAKEAAEMTDAALRAKFEDSVLVVDEVHNIREKITSAKKSEELDDKGDDEESVSASEESTESEGMEGSDDEEMPSSTTSVVRKQPIKRAGDESSTSAIEKKRFKSDESSKARATVNVYDQFNRLFKLLKRRKILLMSGTPMRDGPEEFASVMNLILPVDKQFPTGQTFIKEYFDPETNKIKPEKRAEFVDKINGRVTYLKAIQVASDVARKSFEGERNVGSLKHFVVYPLRMSTFQSRAYVQAMSLDVAEKGLYTHSRQASLMVFPDSSYGQKAFNNPAYIRRYRTRANKVGFTAGDGLRAAIGSGTIEQKLDNLRKLSAIYAFRVERLLSPSKPKTFVYNPFVRGSGLVALACVLECFGFVPATGDERTVGKRYALITNLTATTKEMQTMMALYNSPDNDGEYVQVLLGSRVINEGFTLKNVDEEDVRPHWNNAETEQAIARGWRTGSHDVKFARAKLTGTENDVTLKVFKLAAIPAVETLPANASDAMKSIDLYMYAKSERKDVIIKSVERLMKESAFDCPLTIDVNRPGSYSRDGDRECDYDSCDYECDGKIKTPLDESTYNLYFSLDPSRVRSVRDALQTLFRSKSIVNIAELYDALPTFNSFEILGSLSELMYANETFRDRYGFPCVVRVLDSYSIYASRDPRYRSVEHSRWDRYYVERTALYERPPSFQNVVRAMTEEAMPDIIETIFDNPRYARSLIVKLPRAWQRTILEQCLIGTSPITRRHDGQAAREIVDMFKSYHGVVNGRKTIWLFSDDLEGASVFDESTGEWTNAALPEEYLRERREKLMRSEYGYYGLRNPSSDAFCLRDIRESIEGTDLRRLNVGKRCIDWKHYQLVEIAARNLKIDVPSNVRADYENLPEVRDRLNKYVREKTKNELKVGVDDDADTIRRLLYWSTKTREGICAAMKEWFYERDLIEDSFSCGHQRKKRADFR